MKPVSHFICIALLLFSSVVLGQEKLKGNRIVVSENRGVFDFEKIEISDNIDVVLSQGDETVVSVDADENLMEFITIEAEDSVLSIKLGADIRSKKELKVFVTANSLLKEITIKDKADLNSNSTLFLDSFTLNAEGDAKVSLSLDVINFYLNNNESANVNLTIKGEDAYLRSHKTGKGKLHLTVDNIEAITQGNSSLDVSGECKTLMLKAENRSSFKGEELETNEAEVTCSDASNTFVNVTNQLTVSAINTSEVSIYSEPQITVEKFADKAVLRKK